MSKTKRLYTISVTMIGSAELNDCDVTTSAALSRPMTFAAAEKKLKTVLASIVATNKVIGYAIFETPVGDE